MVLRLGLDAEYVLDRMEMYEVRALLEHSYMRSQEAWERTRFSGYITAKSAGSKIERVSDLVRFPWEGGEIGQESRGKVTKEEVEELKMKAKVIEGLLRGE